MKNVLFVLVILVSVGCSATVEVPPEEMLIDCKIDEIECPDGLECNVFVDYCQEASAPLELCVSDDGVFVVAPCSAPVACSTATDACTDPCSARCL